MSTLFTKYYCLNDQCKANRDHEKKKGDNFEEPKDLYRKSGTEERRVEKSV